MSLLKYFAKKKDSGDNLRLPDVTWTASSTLSEKDLRSANKSVKKQDVNMPTHKVSRREKYNGYSPEQRGNVRRVLCIT